jgi:hypothetical protein
MADNEHSTITTSEETRRQMISPCNADSAGVNRYLQECYSYRISLTYPRTPSKPGPSGYQVYSQLWAMMAGQVDKAALPVFCDRGSGQGGREKIRRQNSQRR